MLTSIVLCGYDYLGQPLSERFLGSVQPRRLPIVGLCAWKYHRWYKAQLVAATNAVTMSITTGVSLGHPVQGQDHRSY